MAPRPVADRDGERAFRSRRAARHHQRRRRETILALAAAANAGRVFWTRRYEGGAKALDARVEAALKARGVEALSFNGRLMREPAELAKSDGTPVGIFKAFLRRHRALGPLPAPTPSPKHLTPAPWPSDAPPRVSIEALKLRPRKPDWSGELSLGESPGEAGALRALESFAAEALSTYADERDSLAHGAASRLSANLRFGEISPRRIAHAVETAAAANPALGDAAEKLWPSSPGAISQRPCSTPIPIWRRVRCGPSSSAFPGATMNPVFAPGRTDDTGYPIVDAGMRQLWRTGYLSNRARLITASFLVKHLLIDWRRGEVWFWDTLIDADPRTIRSTGNGSQAPASIPRPISGSSIPCCRREKFDPNGAYVRQWVPELASLEAPAIHSPWKASSDALATRGSCVRKNLSQADR